MLIFKDTQETFSHPVDGTIVQCGNNLLTVKALGSIWKAKLHVQCHSAYLIRDQAVTVIGRIGLRLIIATQDCEI